MFPCSADVIGYYWLFKFLPIFSIACYFLPFFLFSAACVAYGSSQSRGWIRAASAGLHHSHVNPVLNRAMSATYTIAYSNAGYLTQWARAGIKSAFFWILVGFIITEPQWELYMLFFKRLDFFNYLWNWASFTVIDHFSFHFCELPSHTTCLYLWFFFPFRLSFSCFSWWL